MDQVTYRQMRAVEVVPIEVDSVVTALYHEGWILLTDFCTATAEHIRLVFGSNNRL